MKKLVAAAVATGLAALGLVVTAPGAQAYPDAAVSVSVDHQTVVGGHPVTAHATANVNCVWRLSFLGRQRTGAGTSFSATLTTPRVHRTEHRTLTGSCTYASDSGTSTETRSVPITIVPRGSQVSAPGGSGSGSGSGQGSGGSSASGGSQAAPAPSDSGLLPGTGGPDAAYLLGGVALLALGTGALVVSRRRASRT